jgi:GTP-binding protein EngB required for normal cell division
LSKSSLLPGRLPRITDQDPPSSCVVAWFKTLVRPVLQKTDSPAVVEELDKLALKVEDAEQNDTPLFPICLLGQAGVGKSTLINTLIADANIVVPSGGGSGPLTANALRVIYGNTPSFAVKYHSKARVNETRFILENEIQRQSKIAAPSALNLVTEQIEGNALELDSDEERKTRTEEAIGRARLLVAGAQNATRDLPYLADALRSVLGQVSKFQMALLEEDLNRLESVKTALDLGATDIVHRIDSIGNPKFGHQLRQHASGFLAPLILDMTIEWPSELLRDSLELVDLPGIGILNDAYASITSDYLRNRAKAVMLVVDDRGIRSQDAELLKSSGFLNRLLHASNDLEADPVVLMVVVVKVDYVAEENWRNDKSMNQVAQKTKAQHFIDQVERCRHDVAQRLETFLRDVWDDDSDGKRLVIQAILDKLQVFPVSAPQYRLHCVSDPDEDKPFLPTAESTNILALRAAIAKIAKQCLTEVKAKREETQQRFFEQLRARLEVLSAQRNESRQADEEINGFKESLATFLAPLQREFDTRRGGFRGFLRKTIPIQIEAKVEVAASTARRSIQSDLKKLQDANWRTLQAAVRKEGTFYGARHINLPHDFALRFEEPVAEVWSRGILVDVRRETREFAEYQSSAVTHVLDWARGQEIRVSTRLLEALVEGVKQHIKQVNAVGRDAVEDLREKVRAELIKKIEGPIRRKCQKFVKEEHDFGIGVKARILALFAQMAEEVCETAATPASSLLVERFKEVDKEILAAFGEHSEPLTEAASALIQRQERTLKREDAEVASAIEAALTEMPLVCRAAA